MRIAALAFLGLVFVAGAACAADVPEQHMSIKDHKFVPQTITVPANQKIKLIIKNEDSSAAEFESDELNREKVVPGNREISVYLDPLKAGTYTFFDDYRRDTTTGTIMAQ